MDTLYTSFKVDAFLLLATRLSAHEKDNACAHQYSFELNIGTRKACPPRRISIEAPADNMEMWNWKTTESGRAAFPLFLRFRRRVSAMCYHGNSNESIWNQDEIFTDSANNLWEQSYFSDLYQQIRIIRMMIVYDDNISAFGQFRVVSRVLEREMLQVTTFSRSLAFAVLRALILVG